MILICIEPATCLDNVRGTFCVFIQFVPLILVYYTSLIVSRHKRSGLHPFGGAAAFVPTNVSMFARNNICLDTNDKFSAQMGQGGGL